MARLNEPRYAAEAHLKKVRLRIYPSPNWRYKSCHVCQFSDLKSQDINSGDTTFHWLISNLVTVTD